MYTRQGKAYQGLDHIKRILLSRGFENYFIDGELVYKNKEGLSDSEAFQKGTGIAMSKSEDKSDLKLVVFDIFSVEEFDNGKSDMTYSERREKLNSLKDWLNEEDIEVLPLLYEGADQSKIKEYLDYAEEHDWEGVMLNLNTPYECKRTKNLIKVKSFNEKDLRCIRINIADEGKYKGMLGSIACKYENNIVDVGSGFSDEQRKYYTENPDKIIQHVIAVKYKEETVNKDGGKSLQFPVLISVRDFSDKNVADDE